MHKWLHWIVMDDYEPSFCEKNRTRENKNIHKICSKTAKKYVFLLVDAVEIKIKALSLAAPCYILMLDFWRKDSVNFIGSIITVSIKDAFAFSLDIHLFAFAPFLNENTFIAANHLDFILKILHWYLVPARNLTCLIGNNCNTTYTTADLLVVSMVGCCAVIAWTWLSKHTLNNIQKQRLI